MVLEEMNRRGWVGGFRGECGGRFSGGLRAGDETVRVVRLVFAGPP